MEASTKIAVKTAAIIVVIMLILTAVNAYFFTPCTCNKVDLEGTGRPLTPLEQEFLESGIL